MIILDTNVVSEPLKPLPNQNVVRWLDAQAPSTLYLTTINQAELMSGIENMPQGKRRDALFRALTTQVAFLFDHRILSFDAKAAQVFATCYSHAQNTGNSIGFADCAIAAIATLHGFAVATRNVKDFVGTGAEIINPWEAH